jgi:hypothetical protein
VRLADGRWRAWALAPVLATWAWFYVVDMRQARFAWTLLVVPAGALVGATTRRWKNVLLGAMTGLTAVWALMIPRADNGCTGVSGMYGVVLMLHPVLGLWVAPWALAGNTPGRDES